MEYRQADAPVHNMREVVRLTTQAVDKRWRAYEQQFEDVQRTVSARFALYMHRRGHLVRRRGCGACRARGHATTHTFLHVHAADRCG